MDPCGLRPAGRRRQPSRAEGTMGRESWKVIRDTLAARIAAGDLTPGTRLPTEPELCRAFEAGRHSVRRAVQALAVEGKLRVVQGSGTFVEAAPLINYTIGRRTRFRQNLLRQGILPAGELFLADVVPASGRVAAALGIAEGDPAHRLVNRALADGVPISLGLSFHPAALFPDLGAERAKGRSVSDIYRDHGVPDYVRKRTTLFARRPDPEEAALLNQHTDQPVMVLTKTDVTLSGTAIGYAETVWAGDRVQFTFDGLDDGAADEPIPPA